MRIKQENLEMYIPSLEIKGPLFSEAAYTESSFTLFWKIIPSFCTHICLTNQFMLYGTGHFLPQNIHLALSFNPISAGNSHRHETSNTLIKHSTIIGMVPAFCFITQKGSYVLKCRGLRSLTVTTIPAYGEKKYRE